MYELIIIPLVILATTYVLYCIYNLLTFIRDSERADFIIDSAPNWANYLALNAADTWCWYEDLPVLTDYDSLGMWWNPVGRYSVVDKDIQPIFDKMYLHKNLTVENSLIRIGNA